MRNVIKEACRTAGLLIFCINLLVKSVGMVQFNLTINDKRDDQENVDCKL